MSDSSAIWLSPQQQHVWRSFLRFHDELNTVIARQLHNEGDLSLADFEVLVNLSEAPDGELRVTLLADRMLWERSRLSHQVSRMQKRGLVIRNDDPHDGRASVVSVTDKGRKAIEHVAPGHVDTVRKNLFTQLEDGDVDYLSGVFDRLLNAIHTNNPEIPTCTCPPAETTRT